jgi:hypothetical protein
MTGLSPDRATPRIFVEAWDPDYGSAFADVEMTPSAAVIDPSVEVPRGS